MFGQDSCFFQENSDVTNKHQCKTLGSSYKAGSRRPWVRAAPGRFVGFVGLKVLEGHMGSWGTRGSRASWDAGGAWGARACGSKSRSKFKVRIWSKTEF